MAKKRASRVSTFGSQLTAIISVSLVLFVVGVLTAILLAGRVGSDALKSNVGFVVRLSPDAPDAEINLLKQWFNSASFVKTYQYSSAEDIMSTESGYLGENIAALLDINPYGAEFEVKLSPEYANVDSLQKAVSTLPDVKSVESILTEDSLITALNESIDRLSLILLVVAGALLIVSVVLINNTVHLAIYSRRFVIHTMKLVGASPAFIRRPFISAGALIGFVASTLSAGLLVATMYYSSGVDSVLALCFNIKICVYVVAVVYVIGLSICVIASALATNRYLKSDYDDMFMK